MIRRLIFTMLLGNLIIAGGTQAAAITIDFESFSVGELATSVTADGYTFVSDGSAFRVGDNNFFGTKELLCSRCEISLTRDDGALFGMTSVSWAFAFDGPIDGLITGLKADGSTVSLIVGRDNNQSTAAPSIAVEGFEGLQRVDFTWSGPFPPPRQSMFTGMALDDLALNVVPIPAAVWLFGSALLGLGSLYRRT